VRLRHVNAAIHSFARQRRYEIAENERGAHVQTREWLVQNDQVGIMKERGNE
jgi:hypothetical protein